MAFLGSLLRLLAILAAALACTTDLDCSLNGICPRWDSRKCICDAGWTGTDCGVLDLKPARQDNGYNRTREGISSWGSKIVRDPREDGLYHAFIAEFTDRCGLDYWSPYSRIVRAESRTGADGPYEFVEEVVGRFAHNPTVVWDAVEGRYLMYYIGCPQPNVSEVCSAEEFTCGAGNYVNGESGISVLESWDLRRWVSVGQVLQGEDEEKEKWNADVTNPSPWPLCSSSQGWSWWPWAGRGQKAQDQGILLAYRGCPYNCSGAEQISLAHAPHPSGPYTPLNEDQPIFTNEGGSEDPFLWVDKRGNYHILVHSLEPDGGFGDGPKVGRHAYSRSIEGPWTFNSETLAFSTVVEFETGEMVDYYRRERPQLLFSEDGQMRPEYLTTGVQEVGSKMSYTLMVPVGDGRRKWWW